MQEYNDTNEIEQTLVESIEGLQEINKQMSRLNLRKEELTKNIIEAFSHAHEGQKTYVYGPWKVEIKTPCIYSLNKEMYESGQFNLPEDYNPIRATTAYSIDKRLCEEIMQYAPDNVQQVLVNLIEKKPGKPGVVIKERTQ